MAERVEMTLEDIPTVDIVEKGIYKYVLLTVVDPDTETRKVIVRSFPWASFHDDIYQEVKADLGAEGFRVKQNKGGWISARDNEMLVYGESIAFGPADHEKSAKLIQKAFPEATVRWGKGCEVLEHEEK